MSEPYNIRTIIKKNAVQIWQMNVDQWQGFLYYMHKQKGNTQLID